MFHIGDETALELINQVRNMRKMMAASALTAVYLTGCSVLPGVKQYDTLEDGPGRILQPANIEDATPRDEPFSDLGNKSPYSVNGRFYYVMEDPAHYRARGKASWYGNKIQGRKTSSGETFDMYAMTAAHRNLPLPTYLEVTNLDNGNVAIVKVNDRGPFVDDRLIDLSYAAAVKLGMMEKGMAPVEVRAVTGLSVAKARRQAKKDGEAARIQAGSAKAAMPATATASSMLEVASVDGAAAEVSDDLVRSAEEVAKVSTTVVAADAVAAPAEILAVSPPAIAPVAASENTVSDKPLALQIGAFSDLERAAAYMEKAQALVPAVPAFVTQGLSNNKPIFRVRVGPVNSTALIADVTRALAGGGITDSRVLPMQGGGDCVAGCR